MMLFSSCRLRALSVLVILTVCVHSIDLRCLEKAHCADAGSVVSGDESPLSRSSSPYLRSAATQRIRWHIWSNEAFDRAKRENKLILLDIGATWCHWCHVMDSTTYANADIADILNRSFVSIKVDRDERPDIDRRYQHAAAILGAGGWPLTAFLTPDGKVFAAGTYLPAEDSDGRVGLKTVLERVLKAWEGQREQVMATANEIQQAVEHDRSDNLRGTLSQHVIDKIWASLASSWDTVNGGFGKPDGVTENGVPIGAKFPMGSAIEWTIVRCAEKKDPALLDFAKKTLDAMASGGIHDQIGGGFHRYSIDGSWRIPHFEKILYVQADMLCCYSMAYQMTRDVRYRKVAEGILKFVGRDLSDPQGGYYASQDADAGPNDNATFFTWTPEEIATVLTQEEYQVVFRMFGLDDTRNRMDVTGRFVPQLNVSAEQLSQNAALIERAKAKLLEARLKRPNPILDKSVYVNWNAMMISAAIRAYRALGDRSARDFALKTCDRLLATCYHKGKGMDHRLSSDDSMSDNGPEYLLDDQVQMARALIDAYEVKALPQYLAAARDLMEVSKSRYWDEGTGGFFDRIHSDADFAFLKVRQKPLEDSPTPGANAIAAMNLERLSMATGESKYRDWAEQTMRSLAVRAEEFGRFSASYALAAHFHLNPPPIATIIGKRADLRTQLFWTAALRAFRPGALVLLRDPSEPGLPHPPSKDGKTVAYICKGKTCSPPINGTVELEKMLETFGSGMDRTNSQ